MADLFHFLGPQRVRVQVADGADVFVEQGLFGGRWLGDGVFCGLGDVDVVGPLGHAFDRLQRAVKVELLLAQHVLLVARQLVRVGGAVRIARRRVLPVATLLFPSKFSQTRYNSI